MIAVDPKKSHNIVVTPKKGDQRDQPWVTDGSGWVVIPHGTLNGRASAIVPEVLLWLVGQVSAQNKDFREALAQLLSEQEKLSGPEKQ